MGQTKTEELRWLRANGSEVGLPKSPTLVADGQEEGSLCPGRRANPRQPGEAPNPPLCRCCPGSGLAPTGTSYTVGALRPYSWLVVRYSGCGSGCLRGHKASSRAQGRGVGGREGATCRGSPVAAVGGELQEAAGQRGAHPSAGAGRGALRGLRLCHAGPEGTRGRVARQRRWARGKRKVRLLFLFLGHRDGGAADLTGG